MVNWVVQKSEDENNWWGLGEKSEDVNNSIDNCENWLAWKKSENANNRIDSRGINQLESHAHTNGLDEILCLHCRWLVDCSWQPGC